MGLGLYRKAAIGSFPSLNGLADLGKIATEKGGKTCVFGHVLIFIMEK